MKDYEEKIEKLFTAVQNGDVQALRQILEAGDPLIHCETTHGVGTTPLHSAATSGHEIILKALLEYGANVNAKDNSRRTPLHCAVEEGNLQVVKFLVNNGADVNAKYECGLNSSLGNATALHQAVERATDYVYFGQDDKWFPIVQFLISSGADTNAFCETYESFGLLGKATPLDIAYFREHRVLIEILKPYTKKKPETHKQEPESHKQEEDSSKNIKYQKQLAYKLEKYNSTVAKVFENIQSDGHKCHNCGEISKDYRLSEGVKHYKYGFTSKSLIICRKCGHVVKKHGSKEIDIMVKMKQGFWSRLKRWL